MSPRLETQYGVLGVTDIQPKVTDASSHLIFTTMYVTALSYLAFYHYDA